MNMDGQHGLKAPGFLTRLWLFVSGLWEVSPMLPREYAHYRRANELEKELAAVRGELEETKSNLRAAEHLCKLTREVAAEEAEKHAAEVQTLKVEAEFRERRYKAEVAACTCEVEVLALVVERNRKRVEAETGMAAQQVAEAEARRA